MNNKASTWNYFLKDKTYLIILSATAVANYWYMITHFAIGVDDTALAQFFYDGLSVVTGRWTLFFLNRTLHLNFLSWPTPLLESISVFFLAASAVIWCSIIRSVLAHFSVTIPTPFYCMAASLYLSSPILSELWVYFLSNGMALGYLCTALSVYFFISSFNIQKTKALSAIFISTLLLTIAVGCYETMLECFLIASVFIFLLIRSLSSKTERSSDTLEYRIGPWLLHGIVVTATMVILRFVIHEILMELYHLDSLSAYGVQNYNPLFGDLFSVPGALTMLFKKIYLRYYVNAVMYLPITFWVISVITTWIFSIYFSWKRKLILPLICPPALMLIPVLFSILSGRAGTYHSAQYIPLAALFSTLLAHILLNEIMKTKNNVWYKRLECLSLLILSIMLVLQCIDMNKWFRQDYQKYLEAKSIMEDVANDLISSHDVSKPLVVVGATLPSEDLLAVACVSFDSWQYKFVSKTTNFIDVHLKEKFHVNYGNLGYAYAESPLLSVLTWATNPFEHGREEVMQQFTNFWNMLGYHDFHYISDPTLLLQAKEFRLAQNMTGYPNEGYIYEGEHYIIVSLSPVKSPSTP